MIVKTLGHNSTSFLVNFFHIQNKTSFQVPLVQRQYMMNTLIVKTLSYVVMEI